MDLLVPFALLVGAVGGERLAELVVSRRNAHWAYERGGVEYGSGHYRPMVLLHGGLLAGAVVEVWVADRPVLPVLAGCMLAVTVAAQGLRWWCIASLGRRWNTRVIVLPGRAPVRRGPYRVLRHPNYAAVVVEGVALPLVHTAWMTATCFTVANAILLVVRIRVENAALAGGAEAGR